MGLASGIGGRTVSPRTLFDKIWDEHLVAAESEDAPAVLYVDLHLIHEVTSPQAFAELRARNLRVRRPERTLASDFGVAASTINARKKLAYNKLRKCLAAKGFRPTDAERGP